MAGSPRNERARAVTGGAERAPFQAGASADAEPRRPFTSIPGPRPMPVAGTFGNFFSFMRDPIAYLRRLSATYGPVASMSAGDPRGMIFAFGPDHNQRIMGQPELFLNAGITHLGPRGTANRRVSYGLLNMNGDEHRLHRKLVSPFFQPSRLGGHHATVVRRTEELLGSWAPGRTLDLARAMGELTKRLSAELVLGLDRAADADRVNDAIEDWRTKNFSPFARAVPSRLPGAPHARMLRSAERLERTMLELIDRRRPSITAETPDVLALLIRLHDEDPALMGQDLLCGQAVFIYGASYETTANALTWSSFLISQHPEVMARLWEEGREVLGGAPPTTETLKRLRYLDLVIQESLRLLGPAVYSVRVTAAPTALGGYEIPKGAPVAFSHYITHHMPELYPDPESFRPERWHTTPPAPSRYLPFGSGAHACLGGALATMTMKIALSMVWQRFRLTVVPHSRIDRQVRITLYPKRGLPVALARQDREFHRSKTPVRGNIREMVNL
ncbi:MAG TPA: cytochrome P450 [bacterium]